MNQGSNRDGMGRDSVPRAWLVRAGAQGESEVAALEHGLAIIGFTDVPDLTPATDKDAVFERVAHANPGATQARNTNRAGQLVAFRLRMREGDIVALPLKTRPGRVALGRLTGPYNYLEVEGSRRHTRLVEWIRPDVPRSDFGEDLRYSLGAYMTVCRIRRNDAEYRIVKMLAGQPDPGGGTTASSSPDLSVDKQNVSDIQSATNVADVAHQQILEHIRLRYPAHELARLVNEVLKAEGYVTEVSRPGPDGGADILASRGSVAFEGPRICVQVKATSSPADVVVLRSLQGTMQTFQANQGLLVSWAGFTGQAQREARQSFFTVRLWTADDLLRAIYRTYEQLPKDIQTEIPLERIWSLVHEDNDQS